MNEPEGAVCNLSPPFYFVPQDADALYFQFNDVPRFDPLVKLHTTAKTHSSRTNEFTGIEGIVFGKVRYQL